MAESAGLVDARSQYAYWFTQLARSISTGQPVFTGTLPWAEDLYAKLREARIDGAGQDTSPPSPQPEL